MARKNLLLAGGTLSAAQLLKDVKERELLLTTDTNELYVGTGEGLQLAGRFQVGSTEERTAAPKFKGRFWYDTDLSTLFGVVDNDWVQINDPKGMESVDGAVNGNLPSFGEGGQLKDSGLKVDDEAAAATTVLWTSSKVMDLITETLNALDWQESVKSISATPGEELQSGDRILVSSESATGDFAEHENNIAVYDGSKWSFIEPDEGMVVFNEADSIAYLYNKTQWVPFASTFQYTAGNSAVQVDNSTHKITIVAAKNKGVKVGEAGLEVVTDGTTIVAAEAGGALGVVAAKNGGIDTTAGLKVNVDGTSVVLSEEGKVGVSVAESGGLDATAGLKVKVDEMTIIVNEGDSLEVNNLDFGTFGEA